MELISREMAIDHMRVLGGEDRERLIGILSNKEILPTIESRPKGKWEVTSTMPRKWKCSNCGERYDERLTHRAHNYCVVCGADMRETETVHTSKGDVEFPKGVFDAIYEDGEE